MYTYQMVGLADQNGRTYESKYGTYNKEKKFVINPEYIEFQTTLDSRKILMSYQELINGLFHDDCWSLKIEEPKPKVMTKEEIEKLLGYKIEIQENKDDKIKSNENLCNMHKKCDCFDKNYFCDDLFSFLFNQQSQKP